MLRVMNSLVFSISMVVGAMACDRTTEDGRCDPAEDSAEYTPDPYVERVRADIEACRAALDEYAACGPTAECLPSGVPGVAPFSLRVLLNCAASACAGKSGQEGHQCRYEAMLYSGNFCAEAQRLCDRGDELETWLPLE
jgi:hypothetical protein